MEEKSDNFGNFYLLPLLKLNKGSFGKNNFINSYLGRKKNKLIVKLKKEVEDTYNQHDNYETDFTDEEGNIIVVFKIPRRFLPIVGLFRQGKGCLPTRSASDRLHCPGSRGRGTHSRQNGGQDGRPQDG